VELNLLYNQKTVVGGFANYYYWSSTEDGSLSAWDQTFFNGDQLSYNKGNAVIRVRAVRAF
jgi:spore coat protein CotH